MQLLHSYDEKRQKGTTSYWLFQMHSIKMSRLRQMLLLVQMRFLSESISLFEDFKRFFQFPQVHMLHSKMYELLRTLLLRFVKPDLIIGKRQADIKQLDISTVRNQLFDNDIVVDETVRKAILKMSVDKQHHALLTICSFYLMAATYLIARLPLNNELLSNLTFLHPPLTMESLAIKVCMYCSQAAMCSR